MKRILMLAAAGAAIAASVAFARRRHHREVHAAELAGPEIIIDEVIVHFDYDESLRY